MVLHDSCEGLLREVHAAGSLPIPGLFHPSDSLANGRVLKRDWFIGLGIALTWISKRLIKVREMYFYCLWGPFSSKKSNGIECL